jgi:hypothetical protein
MPSFWFGLMLILLFAVALGGLLPAFGSGTLRSAFPGLFPKTSPTNWRLPHLLSFHAQVNPRDVRPEEEGDDPIEENAQTPVQCGI